VELLARYFEIPLWVLDKLSNSFFRGSLLRATIRNFHPAIIHSFGVQNGGLERFRAFSAGKPKNIKCMIRNWGSDRFWFRRFPRYKA
jgi:hypothetical protein